MMINERVEYCLSRVNQYTYALGQSQFNSWHSNVPLVNPSCKVRTEDHPFGRANVRFIYMRDKPFMVKETDCSAQRPRNYLNTVWWNTVRYTVVVDQEAVFAKCLSRDLKSKCVQRGV
jgi:hypothetical protein